MERQPDPSRLRSALAREILRLPDRLRRRIGIPVVMPLLWEQLVCVCEAYTAVDSPAFEERLDELAQEHGHADWDSKLAQEPFSDKDLERWRKRFESPRGQRFLERALGSALFHRFRMAFQEDARVLAPAVLKVIPKVWSVAYAVDVCFRAAGVLTEDFESMFTAFLAGLEESARSVLSSGELWPGPMNVDPLFRKASVVAADLARRSPQEVVDALDEWNVGLQRKLEGARVALDVSPDGPSQAAHSIVEVIDRLLRTPFTNEEVLAWVDLNREIVGLPLEELVRTNEHRSPKPTKLAQSLCFMSAGQRADPSAIAFHITISRALIRSRKRLQSLKHADTGTERDLMEDVLRTVEAALIVLFRLILLGRHAEGIASRLQGVR